MARHHVLDARDERLMLKMLLDGDSQSDIAEAIGVTQPAVAQWVKRNSASIALARSELESAQVSYAVRGTIRDREKRVAALEDRLVKLQQVIEQRAAAYYYAPGGSTGLMVRDVKGKDGDVEVFAVDTALLAEMRAIERQAAEELGQWAESRQVNINVDARQIIVRDYGHDVSDV